MYTHSHTHTQPYVWFLCVYVCSHVCMYVCKHTNRFPFLVRGLTETLILLRSQILFKNQWTWSWEHPPLCLVRLQTFRHGTERMGLHLQNLTLCNTKKNGQIFIIKKKKRDFTIRVFLGSRTWSPDILINFVICLSLVNSSSTIPLSYERTVTKYLYCYLNAPGSLFTV